MAEPALGKVRIIDIAQRVGVSKATVARVLNHAGKNTIRVSDARKQEILEVAREMHYVPNHAAQTLAGKSNMRIGILVDRGASDCIGRILKCIEEIAESSDFQVMVGQSHDNPQSLYQCYENFQLHGVDGVICLAHEYPGQEDVVRSCFQKAENIVYLEPPPWPAPFVHNDVETGTVEAIRHLHETGRKRIAIWLPAAQDYLTCRTRTRVYLDLCKPPDHVLSSDFPEEICTYILDHQLDAVLADSDIMAARLMRELLRHGIRIPEDVAVIGNNNDIFTSCIYPSLSTIDHHEDLLAQQLFQTVMEIAGLHLPTIHEPVKTTLIIRESSHVSCNPQA